MARSRAVECWPGSGRPDAFWNSVPVMPSFLALAVIMRAKPSSEPPMNSATAAADVVGRFGDQRIDDRLDADRSAGLDAELGRRLRRGMRGERHLGRLLDLARGEPLEDQVERHHLGERRRVARARRRWPKTGSCRYWRRRRPPRISSLPPMPPQPPQGRWPTRPVLRGSISGRKLHGYETMPTPDALLHPLTLVAPRGGKGPASLSFESN